MRWPLTLLPARSQDRWLLAAGLGLLIVGAYGSLTLSRGEPALAAGLVVATVVAIRGFSLLGELRSSVAKLTTTTTRQAEAPGAGFRPPATPELAGLVRAIDDLRTRTLREIAARVLPGSSRGAAKGRGREDSELALTLTGSGLYAPVAPRSGEESDSDPSGLFTSADMVSRLDPRTLRWQKSSRAEQEFLGRALGELRRISFPEIVVPSERERAARELREAVVRGEAHGLVYRVRTAAGGLKAVEMNVSVRCAADRTPLYLRCHLADVTAEVRAKQVLRRRTRDLKVANQRLKQVNRALRELQRRYRDLYQNAPVMYFSVDREGRIRDCNETMLRDLGAKREDLIGRPYPELLAEASRPAFESRHADFLRTGALEVESRWVRPDGSEIDVLITATALRGPDGQIRRSRTVAQNITRRKQLEAELREKHMRLARSNLELERRNRELDEFTRVVSHDLKEPLRGLIAFSDFLAQDEPERLGPQGLEYVRHLRDAAARMRALVDDLLRLSRAGREVGDLAPVALQELLGLIQRDLTASLRARNAELVIAAGLPVVWGDHTRIAQLLTNLIANGIKYNRSDAPCVEVGAGEDEEPEGMATLFVRDNGIGIDARYHEKIFQLFRRLHARDEFEGTGAGLAICQKIVHAHGGRIWVESTPGAGSTFWLTLPKRARPLPTPNDEATVPDPDDRG